MRRLTKLAAGAALILAVSACGSSAASGGAEKAVAITLTKAGCDPAQLEIPAGRTRFRVTNDGAAAVTEFEVLDHGRVVGEVENITPGLSRSFSVTLKPGQYTTLCPGGKTAAEGKLVATGTATT